MTPIPCRDCKAEFTRRTYRDRLCDGCRERNLTVRMERKRDQDRGHAKTPLGRAQSRARNARFYRTHPDRAMASTATWKKANKRRVDEWRAEYRRENRDRLNARQREWCRRNPDIVRSRNARRYALRCHVNGPGMSRDELNTVLTGSLGLCEYCGRRGRLTVDHINPLSAGGVDESSNAAAVCQSCNSSKKDRPLLVWLASRAAA